MTKTTPSLSYKDAGVDIDAGESLIEKIKPLAKSTRRPGAGAELGGFGGAFDLKAAGFNDPILISGTDGVGTKLRIAIESGKLDTVGIDLVAMCVNDVLAQGAAPLFFLDYYATGRLDVDMAANVIAGIAEGCRQSDCALIGGETAEMPGMYEGDDFDLAGFVVGAAERGALLPLEDEMGEGDALIGLASSGPHSNGYSLIRKIVEVSGLAWDAPAPFDEAKTMAEALLAPTRIYVKTIVPLIKTGKIKGLAHITGGGITDNVPRMLPDHLSPKIDFASWPRPAVFKWLQETGNVEEAELRRAFNCGIGMVVCVAPSDADAIVKALNDSGEASLYHRDFMSQRVKTAILISGSGSNMEALIKSTQATDSAAKIVLVISNRPNAGGLNKAKNFGVKTRVIDHKSYKARELFERDIDAALRAHNTQLICNAGFMRILTPWFVKRWLGRQLNIHPSLLPKYKGLHTHARALEAGETEHGCSVHWVSEGMDDGKIIAQTSVPVLDGDTPETLAARVLTQEHELYPRVLEQIAQQRFS